MEDKITHCLLEKLSTINSSESLVNWMKQDLRRAIPHAVSLVTIGTLFGIGSVATHRIGFDYPINLVEELKTSRGSIDDPLMARWFKNGKPNFINVSNLDPNGELRHWRKTLLSYGFIGMSISGVMDHSVKRFVAFQLANPSGGGSLENLNMLGKLSNGMANAAWRSIRTRALEVERRAVCNPILGLTVTELHIIELLAQGLSNKEIARRRGVSDSTIKTQVQRTGAKLGATRRAEIVAIALPMLSALPAQSLIDYDDF